MKSTIVRNPLSVFLSIILICVIVFLNLKNPSQNTIAWDFFGYYLYLPLTFIYQDLQIKDIGIVRDIVETYANTSTLYQVYITPEGGWVIKYTMGIAIINAPFFLIGHIIALLSEHAADGFSTPYQYSVWIGAMFITVVGILALRKVLLHFFSDTISAITLSLIVLGTNYLYNVSFIAQNVNPQNYGFTFYTIILYLTIRWHKSHQLINAILLAFVCGILILSRPTEIVCLLIPVFWEVSGSKSLREKLGLLKKEKKQVMIFALILFLIGSLQVFYWLAAAGEFVELSYGDVAGEGMDFLTPHFDKVLFSFRKGWFIYTPLMVLPILGLVCLYQVKKNLFIPVFTYFIFNLYLVSCWSTWWYAECWGQRGLIPSYAVLSIPLGYFLVRIGDQKSIHRWLVYVVILALTGLNLFQTWQYYEGILSGSRMTREYYFRTFLKTKATEADRKLLLVSRDKWPVEYVPDEDDYHRSELYRNSFIQETEGSADSVMYIHLDTTKRFSPDFTIRYKDMTSQDHAYIRASVEVFIPEDHSGETPLLVMAMRNRKGLYKYTALDISADSVKYNAWNTISKDYLTPEIRWKKDKLQVYLWYRGNDHVFIRDLKLDLFNPK